MSICNIYFGMDESKQIWIEIGQLLQLSKQFQKQGDFDYAVPCYRKILELLQAKILETTDSDFNYVLKANLESYAQMLKNAQSKLGQAKQEQSKKQGQLNERYQKQQKRYAQQIKSKYGKSGQKTESFQLEKTQANKLKQELIKVLDQSQLLWSQQETQQSVKLLKKAINILDEIIQKEVIQAVKKVYSQKRQALFQKLTERQSFKKQTNNIYACQDRNTHQEGFFKEKYSGKNVRDCIPKQDFNVKWQDVIGLEVAKSRLQQAIVFPFRFPELFTGTRKPYKSILLYGPPGTGKTLLGKICSSQGLATFFNVSPDFMRASAKKNAKFITQLFETAREKRPSVIFIDDIEQTFENKNNNAQKNQAAKLMKKQFLRQMKRQNYQGTSVFVLANTAKPWVLDPDIIKKFEFKVFVCLPSQEERFKIIKKSLAGNNHSIPDQQFEKIAKQTENFTPSDLVGLARDTLMEPIRRVISAKKFKKINGKFFPCEPGEQGIEGEWITFKDQLHAAVQIVTIKDLLSSLSRVKPSISQEQLEKFAQFEKIHQSNQY